MKISDHDQRELDAFEKMIRIARWRVKELGEPMSTAESEACLEVYGDKFGEGNKHHDSAE